MKEISIIGMTKEEVGLVDAVRTLLLVYIKQNDFMHAFELLACFRNVMDMIVEDIGEMKHE